ncbi:hypothetical protein ACQ4PT_022053 [Festuca glaucescens]
MALSPSSIRRQDVGPRDSPPPTSQGGSSNGAKADVARKTKDGIDHLLTKLEKEGLEIDGKIASIIDDGIARIKAEAASNGATTDVARKTKDIDHLFAKLEKEGLEIDGKIASIIDDGIARIKAEAARENINEPKSKVLVLLLTISSVTLGFLMGMEWQENHIRKNISKELAKRRRA